MVKNVVYEKVLRDLFSVGSFLFNLAITLYFLLASICIFFLKNDNFFVCLVNLQLQE